MVEREATDRGTSKARVGAGADDVGVPPLDSCKTRGHDACWDDLLGSAQRIGDAALEAECLRKDVKTMR